MRIPSSLTDENLYRRRGRQAMSLQPHRRLFRLLLAIVLVIAVMRQAGDPRIYEVFFPAPPAALHTAPDEPVRAISRVTAGSKTATVALAQHGASDSGGAEGQLRDAQDADVQDASAAQIPGAAETLGPAALAEEPLTRTVAGLDEATAVRLIAWLAQRRAAAVRDDSPAQPAPLREDSAPLPSDLIDALNSAAHAAGEPLLSAAEAARAGRDLGEDSSDQPSDDIEPATIDWSEPSTLRRLQEALDHWAIDRVDPGSIWKATDSLAFYRLLEEPTVPWLRRQEAAQPGVISMLQQPEVYLHRRVAVSGTVARAISRQAAENPSGIEAYWELWIRPRDGSEQPLVFFTAEAPPEISRIGADASLAEGPLVWIQGIYLKRLAYRSASGRQLAPAVVGSLHPVKSVSVADVAAAPPVDQPSGWMIIGISALLGGGLAVLIFYQAFRATSPATDRRRWANPSAARFLGSLSSRSEQHGGGDR